MVHSDTPKAPWQRPGRGHSPLHDYFVESSLSLPGSVKCERIAEAPGKTYLVKVFYPWALTSSYARNAISLLDLRNGNVRWKTTPRDYGYRPIDGYGCAVHGDGVFCTARSPDKNDCSGDFLLKYRLADGSLEWAVRSPNQHLVIYDVDPDGSHLIAEDEDEWFQIEGATGNIIPVGKDYPTPWVDGLYNKTHRTFRPTAYLGFDVFDDIKSDPCWELRLDPVPREAGLVDVLSRDSLRILLWAGHRYSIQREDGDEPLLQMSKRHYIAAPNSDEQQLAFPVDGFNRERGVVARWRDVCLMDGSLDDYRSIDTVVDSSNPGGFCALKIGLDRPLRQIGRQRLEFQGPGHFKVLAAACEDGFLIVDPLGKVFSYKPDEDDLTEIAEIPLKHTAKHEDYVFGLAPCEDMEGILYLTEKEIGVIRFNPKVSS